MAFGRIAGVGVLDLEAGSHGVEIDFSRPGKTT
jgi:hypothetical protein